MSVIDDLPAEVEAYLIAVRATLSDLPATEREDLLAEVEASLRDAAEEGGAIAPRLGSPEEFAAELRAAAGLHELPPASSRRSLREAIGRLASDPRTTAVRRLAGDLAPVWWVARAYAAVAGTAAVAGSGWSTRYPAVPRLGSGEGGLALIVLAAVASVVLGLRGRNRTVRIGRAGLVANLACVLLAVPAAGHLTDSAVSSPQVVTVLQPIVPPGLTDNGAPVQNIYPYSREGKLLHDVLLYDGAGNPIEIGGAVPDPNRRVLRTSGNRSVLNSFPIRYYEPGTVRVAHPDAGPPVRPPNVLPLP
jgi:HAAS domain-containing protein